MGRTKKSAAKKKPPLIAVMIYLTPELHGKLAHMAKLMDMPKSRLARNIVAHSFVGAVDKEVVELKQLIEAKNT